MDYMQLCGLEENVQPVNISKHCGKVRTCMYNAVHFSPVIFFCNLLFHMKIFLKAFIKNWSSRMYTLSTCSWTHFIVLVGKMSHIRKHPNFYIQRKRQNNIYYRNKIRSSKVTRQKPKGGVKFYHWVAGLMSACWKQTFNIMLQYLWTVSSSQQ